MAKNTESLPESPEIHYTTVTKAVTEYKNDPHGLRKLSFLEKAYGLNNISAVLEAAEMGDYLKYKQEGRMIGLVATQILKPNFYFLSNAIILNELAKQGIPTALMVFEYPEDIFLTRNHDKKAAFGWQEFYLEEKQSVKVNVQPSKVKSKSFPIRTIDAASNQPCDQIMIQIAGQGPGNMSYPNADYALGLNIPEEISVTDFYKKIWQQALARLNLQIPVFYVNMVKLYSTLAEASPVFGYQKRMLTSVEYYPLQVAWPDLYLECSSHASPDFLENVAHAQQIRYQAGLSEVQVRLPHEQTPELENLLLHPTGRFVDFSLNPDWIKLDQQIRFLAAEKSYKQIKPLRLEQAQLQSSLNPQQYVKEVPFSLPPPVEQIYQSLLNSV